MECSVQGCERPHLARGWCRRHYEAWRRSGDPLHVRAKPGTCSEEGCERPTVGRGWCATHYSRYWKRTRSEELKRQRNRRCKFCGGAVPLTRTGKSLYCSKVCKDTHALGLASAEYERLLAAQGGKCAICRRPEPNGRHLRWCIDHDHATGRIRGLLCINCNSAIGLLNDDADILRRAIAYLG